MTGIFVVFGRVVVVVVVVVMMMIPRSARGNVIFVGRDII